MIKYADGREVCVGDKVALHHARNKGVVTHILDSQSEIDDWNLEEPGLMIDTDCAGLVFYPKWSLTDDEIRLVSRAESSS